MQLQNQARYFPTYVEDYNLNPPMMKWKLYFVLRKKIKIKIKKTKQNNKQKPESTNQQPSQQKQQQQQIKNTQKLKNHLAVVLEVVSLDCTYTQVSTGTKNAVSQLRHGWTGVKCEVVTPHRQENTWSKLLVILERNFIKNF